MVFVFDLDDTICDTDAYSEKYIKEFFALHNLPYKQIATVVRFAEQKFDWSTEAALAWYKKFGDKMMEEFPCKAGAAEVLKKLHAAGHKIIIATARADDWHNNPEKVTKNWLSKNNIVFDKLYVGRKDKEAICKEVDADVFVDDDINIVGRVAKHFANTKSGSKQAFLMNTAYNKDLQVPEGAIRINSLQELPSKFPSAF